MQKKLIWIAPCAIADDDDAVMASSSHISSSLSLFLSPYGVQSETLVQ